MSNEEKKATPIQPVQINSETETMSGAARQLGEGVSDPQLIHQSPEQVPCVVVPIGDYKEGIIVMHKLSVALERANNLLGSMEDTEKRLLKKARHKFIEDLKDELPEIIGESSMLQKRGNVFTNCQIKAVVTDPDEDANILGTVNHGPHAANMTMGDGVYPYRREIPPIEGFFGACQPKCGECIDEGGEIYEPSLGINEDLLEILKKADPNGDILIMTYMAANRALHCMASHGSIKDIHANIALEFDGAAFQEYIDSYPGPLSVEYVTGIRNVVMAYCAYPSFINHTDAIVALMDIAFYREIVQAFGVYTGDFGEWNVTPEMVEIEDPDLNIYDTAIALDEAECMGGRSEDGEEE